MTTDRENLQHAFDLLETSGWVARANYLCCTECGFNGIWEETQALLEEDVEVKGMVFWHNGDDEYAFGYWPDGTAVGVDRNGGERNPWDLKLGNRLLAPLYLGWDDFSGGNGEEIVTVLIKAGFLVTPPSESSERIKVSTDALAVNDAGLSEQHAGSTVG
jgi:hypothetical protein